MFLFFIFSNVCNYPKFGFTTFYKRFVALIILSRLMFSLAQKSETQSSLRFIELFIRGAGRWHSGFRPRTGGRLVLSSHVARLRFEGIEEGLRKLLPQETENKPGPPMAGFLVHKSNRNTSFAGKDIQTETQTHKELN